VGVLVGRLTISGVVGLLTVDVSGLEDLLGLIGGLWDIFVDGLSLGVEDGLLGVSVLDFGDGSWDLSGFGLSDGSELGLSLVSVVSLLIVSVLGLGDGSVLLDWDLSDSLLGLGVVLSSWDLSGLFNSDGFLDFLGDINVLGVLLGSVEGLGSLLGDLSWDLSGLGVPDNVEDLLWDLSVLGVVLGLVVDFGDLSSLFLLDGLGGWGGDSLVEGLVDISVLSLLGGLEDVSWDLLLVLEVPGVVLFSWDVSVLGVGDSIVDSSWLISGASSLLGSVIDLLDSLGLGAVSWLIGGVWNLDVFDSSDVLGVLVVVLLCFPSKFGGLSGDG